MLRVTSDAKKLTYLLLALACFGPASASHAQRCFGGHSAHAPLAGGRHQQPLQLTTSVIDRQFSKNVDGSLALSLKLQLRYTNVGNQPLILYKGSKLIHRHTTSRSVRDAEAKRFLSDHSLSIYSQGGAEINELSLDRLFVILQPGDSYERDALNFVVLQVEPNATEATGAALSPGEYMLQVTTSTWPDSEKLAKELRHQWQQSGLLWYDPVVSVPMLFKVEQDHNDLSTVVP